VTALAVAPASSRVASGSLDMTINLWKADTGGWLATLLDHEGAIRALAVAPDESLLISAGDDCSIRFWRLADHRYVGCASDPALPVRNVVSFSC